MFGFLKSRRDNEFTAEDTPIKFHTDANLFGEHGEICVSHRKKGMDEKIVRFVFAGMSTPPVLSAQTFQAILDAAKEEGYIVHYLHAYGKHNEIVKPNQAAMASQDTRFAASTQQP